MKGGVMKVRRILYRAPAINLPVVEKKTWSLDELERILIEAIRASTIKCAKCNHGIVVTALSGGLDSSFCLAVIRKQFGKHFFPIHTFTIASSPEHPDAAYARFIADHFKTAHHTYFPGEKDLQMATSVRAEIPRLFSGETSPISGLGPYFLFKYMREDMPAEVTSVITHDGIDELLGGYWPHRQRQTPQEQLEVFQKFWKELPENHLIPLAQKAEFFGVTPIFPYLQKSVVRYIAGIPLSERTSHDVSKIPLREIAKKYLPPEIIQRRKIGFCDALKTDLRCIADFSDKK